MAEGEVFAKDIVGEQNSKSSTHPVPGPLANGHLTNGFHETPKPAAYHETRKPWETVNFDPSLRPKSYEIKGTPEDSTILFLDVEIFDSTGSAPYRGDVMIKGQRFAHVGKVPDLQQHLQDPNVKIVKGQGRTLMSGLGDAHTHLSWNSGDIPALAGLGVEEHTLLTARSAQTALDSGYTMCFGAASAQDRLDIVIRDAINVGKLPGPRYLANCKEITRTQDAVGQNGLAVIADGPEEMRAAVSRHIDLGADQVKLTMSGEEICEPLSSEQCYYTDEDTAVCVEVAHGRGRRLCAHARARDSVKMCVKHGVDIIFHASWTDDEGMDMLEKAQDKHMVVPAINWLYATLYESEAYGYSMSEVEKNGYRREFANAKKVLTEMHRRGITVLPGGDYGFQWTPHGTYARDLEHFVNWLGFTPMESLLAATAGVAKLFMREHELGKVLPGYYADCILVEGDPLSNISVLQDHSRLNMIMINGRIHKALQKDFLTSAERKVMAKTSPVSMPAINGDSHSPDRLTNFVAYRTTQGADRIGHLDLATQQVTPLGSASGYPWRSLHQVISCHETPVAVGEPFRLDTVTLLPPIQDRDVLAVGKNYAEHAKEFHASGYDSSDRAVQPSHPVIFTKRHTSIIASGQSIVLVPQFTQTLDYEGEIGVILGKSGIDIDEADAMDYVWGYTIINDVTAREVQRDHKQFFLGKSGDTYCPMGPIAVPKESLPKTLHVQTFVNGQLRQDATTDELIFSITRLIATISKGATIRAGDVIATGTPAGVGFGQSPPTYLEPNDLVEISVTGLGKLSNRVKAYTKRSVTYVQPPSFAALNASRTPGETGLTRINNKLVHLNILGTGTQKAVFIHGLGGTTELWTPLLMSAGLLESHQCYLYDLEGHGLTPTQEDAAVSIGSYVDDLSAIVAHVGQPMTLFAHSMGALIALSFAAHHPELVTQLILLGPAAYPVSTAAAAGQIKRAAAVQAGGMKAIVDAIVSNALSEKTRSQNPVALTLVKTMLLSQDPEGYARACNALGQAPSLQIDFTGLQMPTLIVTGADDKASPPSACEKMMVNLKNAQLEVVQDVGHWHAIEDSVTVGRHVRDFLSRQNLRSS